MWGGGGGGGGGALLAHQGGGGISCLTDFGVYYGLGEGGFLLALSELLYECTRLAQVRRD